MCVVVLLCCVIDDSSQSKKRIVHWIRNHKEKNLETISPQPAKSVEHTQDALRHNSHLLPANATMLPRERRMQINPTLEDFLLLHDYNFPFSGRGTTTLIVQFSVHLLFCFLFFSLSSATVLCCVLCAVVIAKAYLV